MLLFATLIGLLTGCNQVPQADPDPRVWNNPPADSYSHTSRNGGWDFNIQKVELGDTETTVHMLVKGYSGQLYTFAQETSLKADGQSYKLLSIDGLTPGQYKPLDKSRLENLTFHFEPMPATVTSFDLLESETNPRAFNVYGIHKYDPDSKKITGTHWRNLRTGDWVISFLDSCVIYDCRVWHYLANPEPETGAGQTVVIENDDNQVASIMISPIKHGKRTFRFQTPDGPMQVTCAMFESKHLPDYSKVGRRAYKLVDYGYEKVDTVTVSGVTIGPGRSNMSFTIDVIDPISGQNPNFAFKTDDNGFFTVRFPLTNTSVAVVRGGRISGFSMPVEPGQTYFVYDNTITGQEFVMGRNSRVQNDFMTHSDHFYADYDRIEESAYSTDMDAYLNYLIGERDKQFAHLDSLLKEHPSITECYIDMSRAYATIDMYRMIGQSRFNNPDNMYELPSSMIDFIRNDLKVNPIAPYSLFYDFNYFLRDFVQSLYQTPNKTVTVNMTDIIANELAAGKGVTDYINQYAQKILYDREFNTVVNAFDSLGFEKRLKEIFLTHYMVEQITSSRHSAPAAILARYDSIVTYKPCKDAVHQQNEKYLALENVDLASLGDVVSAQDLAGMTDGEQILRKITEPYRGKIVYIDVWGSWCHPCLENLEHAGELKQALKDFDIIYLYLASSTSDSAWKGVIKEYNLTGPDCVHYNLPGDQQILVEQFLKVTGYPTYRLLNRNGTLLDVSCSPGNIPALIQTLKKL